MVSAHQVAHPARPEAARAAPLQTSGAARKRPQRPRTGSFALEFWPILDPSLIEGSREMRLEAYRALRDHLLARLIRRFPPRGAPVVG